MEVKNENSLKKGDDFFTSRDQKKGYRHETAKATVACTEDLFNQNAEMVLYCCACDQNIKTKIMKHEITNIRLKEKRGQFLLDEFVGGEAYNRLANEKDAALLNHCMSEKHKRNVPQFVEKLRTAMALSVVQDFPSNKKVLDEQLYKFKKLNDELNKKLEIQAKQIVRNFQLEEYKEPFQNQEIIKDQKDKKKKEQKQKEKLEQVPVENL